MLYRANQPNCGDHQTHCRHRGERGQAQADHRRHAGVRRRRQQQRVVSWKTCCTDTCAIFSLEELLKCVCVCVCVFQLEADHRLHRSAVWAILQGWERAEQKEHPGQQSPLLPLLHSSVRARVMTHRHTQTQAVKSSTRSVVQGNDTNNTFPICRFPAWSCAIKLFFVWRTLITSVSVLTWAVSFPQAASSGCRVHEGPAWKSEHYPADRKSWLPHTQRDKEAQRQSEFRLTSACFILRRLFTVIIHLVCVCVCHCGRSDTRGNRQVWDQSVPVPGMWLWWGRRV